MKITMLSCWQKRYYADYTRQLKQALEPKIGEEVKIVTTNCGCAPPYKLSKEALIDQRCDLFNMPTIPDYKSKKKWKYYLRAVGRKTIAYFRAIKFAEKTKNSDIVHFQQVLNAFGSLSVFQFLNYAGNKPKKVITIHEIDSFQNEFKKLNATYNKADKVIVHFEELKQYLVKNGVMADKIEIIHNGTEIPPLYDYKREGIIFHGGTHVASGKGWEDILNALKILRAKGIELRLRVCGNYGEPERIEALQIAEAFGVAGWIDWLEIGSIEFKGMDRMNREYQKSLLCVLPYTKGTAGFQTAVAMANAVPVIGTKKAGIDDHLGDTGVYVRSNSPEDIAAAIEKLVTDNAYRADLASRARERAINNFSWDVIADQTLALYKRILQ